MLDFLFLRVYNAVATRVAHPPCWRLFHLKIYMKSLLGVRGTSGRIAKALQSFMVLRLGGALLALPLVGFSLTSGANGFPQLVWDNAPLVTTEVSEAKSHIRELFDKKEILWFARAIHSESKLANEQRHVAWVIRNRVESGWYPDSYQDVVLQPHQFSGLNDYDAWYDYNMSRDYDSTGSAWESALVIAEDVYTAPTDERLLGETVLHFYSPIAVDTPEWASGKTPVKTIEGTKGTHFAFFSGVK